MDVRAYNRDAWNREVDRGNRWTIPVSPEHIERARRGELELLLTPQKPVPRGWLEPLEGADILCLASGGGQQGPLLAAAGANVTVLDNSPRQLDQDRFVADREGLSLSTVEGDMAHMPMFEASSFDLVFHPCSNCFVPDVLAVWNECGRVLRDGGTLLAGFNNPVRYIFDYNSLSDGTFIVRHELPYDDLTGMTEDERKQLLQGEPIEYSHSLDTQIGGQIAAGFSIIGFYEDHGTVAEDPISRIMPTFVATRAQRLAKQPAGV